MAGHKSIWAQTARRKRGTTAGAATNVHKVRNEAPSQWGRRLARLVGEKFNVKMSDNWSKNVGIWQERNIVIKCAKSPMPPVSVLIGTLESIDELWAVYVMPEGHAEIWSVPVREVRAHGYFTHGARVPKRVEITRRKILALGAQIGTLDSRDVDSCRIP